MATNLKLNGDFTDTVNVNANFKVTGRADFADKNVYIGNIPLASKLGGSNVAAFEVTTDTEHELCSIYIRTHHEKTASDVVIEWGDDTATILSEVSDTDYYHSPKDETDYVDNKKNSEMGEYNVWAKHTYTVHGKHIVKISGTTYWGIMNGPRSYDTSSKVITTYPSVISRIFDTDLPWFDGILDIASIASGSTVLKSIRIPNYFNIEHIINWSGAFQNCTALEKVEGHKSKMFVKRMYAAGTMFSGCTALKTSNWNIPMSSCIYSSMAKGFYNGCANLEADINDLLPKSGFSDRRVMLDNVFNGCVKITGTAPSDILWDDTSKVWSATSCFKNCTSLENYASIPSTWK